MLVVHNSDEPGMIGHVTSLLGDAKVNISNMGVGRSPSGEAALMVLATDSKVSPETIEVIAAVPGVQSARAIDLGN
jgi:D-3-phosphoglycerate dehydrogenase